MAGHGPLVTDQPSPPHGGAEAGGEGSLADGGCHRRQTAKASRPLKAVASEALILARRSRVASVHHCRYARADGRPHGAQCRYSGSRRGSGSSEVHPQPMAMAASRLRRWRLWGQQAEKQLQKIGKWALEIIERSTRPRVLKSGRAAGSPPGSSRGLGDSQVGQGF